MKRVLVLLLLSALAGLPAALPAGASLPLQATCFGETPTPGHTGTDGDDVIYGTPGDDVIRGRGGNDTIYGGGGRDRICGGEGDDIIYGGPGGDLLDGDWDDDRIYGQGGNDGFLLGDDGNDLLVPGPGNLNYTATIEGGAGRDRIVIAAAGYNEIFGGDGRDTIDFRRSPAAIVIDLKWGEFGNRYGAPLLGGRAFETENVFGSAYPDVIRGKAGANRLFGFAEADGLFGRAGDDYLDGGAHVGDWMEGGDGTDTCVDPDGWIVRDECEA